MIYVTAYKRIKTANLNKEQELERTKENTKQERSEWAKDHVWQILRHKLRRAEGISGSVVVETEPWGQQQMLFVKCYGPAAARVSEIRKLLETTKRGLALQGFILTVKEETQRGADFSLLWGPPGPWDDDDGGSNLSESVPTAGVSNQSPKKDDTPPADRFHEADRFANTPYWNSTSILVDCLFPPRPQLANNTLCGALLRMMSWEHQGQSELRTWTCGGLIHVNGVPYALTTAHPLILKPRGMEQDGVGTTKPSVIDDVFPEEHGLFPEIGYKGMDGAHNWQTLGRVHKHAMSSGFYVPANYDWLLIDIAKDYLLPNFSADHVDNQDVYRAPHPRPLGFMSICTWRGSLQATLLSGFSFIIIGDSSFKTMKLSVDQPMGVSALTFLYRLNPS